MKKQIKALFDYYVPNFEDCGNKVFNPSEDYDFDELKDDYEEIEDVE